MYIWLHYNIMYSAKQLSWCWDQPYRFFLCTDLFTSVWIRLTSALWWTMTPLSVSVWLVKWVCSCSFVEQMLWHFHNVLQRQHTCQQIHCNYQLDDNVTMTAAVVSLKKPCSLFMARSESSTSTKSKPQLPKSTLGHVTRSSVAERRAQISVFPDPTCEGKGRFTSVEHTGDTFDAKKILSACLSWNLGQTWQE